MCVQKKSPRKIVQKSPRKIAQKGNGCRSWRYQFVGRHYQAGVLDHSLSSGCTQPKTNSLKSRRHSGTWAEGGVWPRATECRGFESEQKAHKASMPRLPGWDRSMKCRCGRPRVDSGAYERAAYRAKPRSDHPYSDFTDRSGPRTCHSCILIGASQGHRICPP